MSDEVEDTETDKKPLFGKFHGFRKKEDDSLLDEGDEISQEKTIDLVLDEPSQEKTKKAEKIESERAKVKETKDAEDDDYLMTRKSTSRKNIQSTGLTANGMIMRMKFHPRLRNQ